MIVDRLIIHIAGIGIVPEIFALQRKRSINKRQFGSELIRAIRKKSTRICQTHIGHMGFGSGAKTQPCPIFLVIAK